MTITQSLARSADSVATGARRPEVIESRSRKHVRATVRGSGRLVVGIALALTVVLGLPPTAARADTWTLDHGALFCRAGHATVAAPIITSTGYVAWRVTWYFYDDSGTYHGNPSSEWVYGYGGSADFPRQTWSTLSFVNGGVYVLHEIYDYDTGETTYLWAANSLSGDTWCNT